MSQQFGAECSIVQLIHFTVLTQVTLRIVSPSTLLEDKHASRSFCVSKDVLRENSKGEFCLVLFLVKFADVIRQPFLRSVSLCHLGFPSEVSPLTSQSAVISGPQVTVYISFRCQASC